MEMCAKYKEDITIEADDIVIFQNNRVAFGYERLIYFVLHICTIFSSYTFGQLAFFGG